MRHYPLFVSLESRICLVVGGGRVGERKISILLKHGAEVRLVAQSLTAELEAQCQHGTVSFLGKEYSDLHMDGVDLVFAATSDPALNQQIASDAQARRLWCNMASHPELGSFFVPSILQRGPLTIAVSTSGISPAVARGIRENLERQFGPEWEPFLILLGQIRIAIQEKQLGSDENQILFKKLAKLPLLEYIRTGQREEALQALHQLLEPLLSWSELSHFWNKTCTHCFSSSQPPAI